MKYYYYFLCCIILGCSNKKSLCYKKLIINNKFTSTSKEQEKVDLLFTDSNQLTFINGKLYAEARVLWHSCSKYALIVKNAYYTNGLRVGDTLEVNIMTLKNDTFYYTATATAYGQSVSAKFVKVK